MRWVHWCRWTMYIIQIYSKYLIIRKKFMITCGSLYQRRSHANLMGWAYYWYPPIFSQPRRLFSFSVLFLFLDPADVSFVHCPPRLSYSRASLFCCSFYLFISFFFSSAILFRWAWYSALDFMPRVRISSLTGKDEPISSWEFMYASISVKYIFVSSDT